MRTSIGLLYPVLLLAGIAVALWGIVQQDRFMHRLRTMVLGVSFPGASFLACFSA